MNKRSIALLLNCIIVLFEIIGTIMAVANNGVSVFAYYTVLSNVILMLAGIVYVLFVGVYREIPRFVYTFKFVATCMVLVTFLVVVFVLIPNSMTDGAENIYYILLRKESFFHHFSCPILAFVTLLFFEEGCKFSWEDVLLAVVPTLQYAIVIVALNLDRRMYGPYFFLHIYEQTPFASFMWFIGILGGNCLVAWLLKHIKNKRFE